MKLAKIVCIILSAVFCFMIFGACDPGYGYVKLSSNSYFDRMIIQDGKVYMLCYLEFVNNTGSEWNIDVTAASEEDEENGLLKDSRLTLYIVNAENLSDVNETNLAQLLEPADRIGIDEHGTVRYCACFVGEHGGGTQKHDRDLPDMITIAARP
ncbi:MAG: hypothetical protein J6P98_00655 [Clostridia bacterium]|nr:hypothetical protein [Clostridia bacterium]